ncbi:hypothetical protein Bca101_054409 [Brassica carinata]
MLIAVSQTLSRNQCQYPMKITRTTKRNQDMSQREVVVDMSFDHTSSPTKKLRLFKKNKKRK